MDRRWVSETDEGRCRGSADFVDGGSGGGVSGGVDDYDEGERGCRKRPRLCRSSCWHVENGGGGGEIGGSNSVKKDGWSGLGLKDLFFRVGSEVKDRRRWTLRRRRWNGDHIGPWPSPSPSPSTRSAVGRFPNSHSSCTWGRFTFRLDHRLGGPASRHRGEERILIFRSDRPGAVAKIIYSSEPAASRGSTLSGGIYSGCGCGCGSVEKKKEKEELDLESMNQAKIHVLDVKEPYRGRDLGGLLFSEAILSLRDRYRGNGDAVEDVRVSGGGERGETGEAAATDTDSRHCSCPSISICCRLDAEDDVRRYNKLVKFYEGLGCSVRPDAKVRYLNNNDGETYRSVPMQIALRPTLRRRKASSAAATSLVRMDGGFLPVRIFDSVGKQYYVPPSRRCGWIVADDGRGGLYLRTTHGHCVIATHDGKVDFVPADDNDVPSADCDCCRGSDAGRLILCHVSDTSAAALAKSASWATTSASASASAPSTGSDATDDNEEEEEEEDEEDERRNDEARKEELWILRSAAHGTFLSVNVKTRTICCSKMPTFWQADGDSLTLTCITDALPKSRSHHRMAWKTQCVSYVERMMGRYQKFNLATLELRDALLTKSKSIPCHPFRVWPGTGLGRKTGTGPTEPSLRTFSFRAAETARLAGLPDWIQIVALVHDLGRIVVLLDNGTSSKADAEAEVDADAAAKEVEEEEKEKGGGEGYDWTISSQSRVVGCSPPDHTSFREYHDLNPDGNDPKYDSRLGMYRENCGLDNALLSWSGPEYMFRMLKHNNVAIPDEGLAVLRLFLLRAWHEYGQYGYLSNQDDEEVRVFVSDFDMIRRQCRRECDGYEMTDAECQLLWDGYYAKILEKYNCGGKLSW